MKLSPLAAFYTGKAPDSSGRMFDDILSWGDEELESVHDYIQWLFPLQEKSAFNDRAPLVTAEDLELFRTDIGMQTRFLRAFARLLDFYGFVAVRQHASVRVVRVKNFAAASGRWLTPRNHNFLRMTRILKSLMLFGQDEFATAFLRALEEVYGEHAETIGKTTLAYWTDAVRSRQ